MRTLRTITLGVLAAVGLSTSPVQAHVGWSVGVHFGAPCYYHPYCGYYYSYRPYPIYVEPAPVVVQPVPVYQPAAVAQPAYQPPPPAATASYTPAGEERPAEIDQNLRQLADPDEHVRAEAAVQLGRVRAERAVDPLAATLAGDKSPVAREAAARGLGLIGSPKALPALKYAAQADSDRDVRHSAQFSIEVIQASMRR